MEAVREQLKWKPGLHESPEMVALMTKIHARIDDVHREKEKRAKEKAKASYERRRLKLQQEKFAQQFELQHGVQPEKESSPQSSPVNQAFEVPTTKVEPPVYHGPQGLNLLNPPPGRNLLNPATMPASPQPQSQAPPPAVKPVYRGELYKVVSNLSQPMSRPTSVAGDRPKTKPQQFSQHPSFSPVNPSFGTNVEGSFSPEQFYAMPLPADSRTSVDPQSQLPMPTKAPEPDETLPVIRRPRYMTIPSSSPAQSKQPPSTLKAPIPPATQTTPKVPPVNPAPISKLPESAPTPPLAPPPITNATWLLISALHIVRGSLNDQEIESVNRVVSLEFDDENMFKVLLLEKIIEQEQIPQLRGVYESCRTAQLAKPKDPSAPKATPTTPKKTTPKKAKAPSKPATKPSKPATTPVAKPPTGTPAQPAQPPAQPPALEQVISSVPATAVLATALPSIAPKSAHTPKDLWILDTMREFSIATDRTSHIDYIDGLAKTAASPVGAVITAGMIKAVLWREDDLVKFRDFGREKVARLAMGQAGKGTKGVVYGGSQGGGTGSTSTAPATNTNGSTSTANPSKSAAPKDKQTPNGNKDKPPPNGTKPNGQPTPAIKPLPRPHPQHSRSTIALSLPKTAKTGTVPLLVSILSWPTDQIARTVLLAAGRPVPGEEAPRLNADFEVLKERFCRDFKFAELSTVEWDVIDPPAPGMRTVKPVETSPVATPPQVKSAVAVESNVKGPGGNDLIGTPFKKFSEIDAEDESSHDHVPLSELFTDMSILTEFRPPDPASAPVSSTALPPLGKSMFVRKPRGRLRKDSKASNPAPPTAMNLLTPSPQRPTPKTTPQVIIYTPRKTEPRITPPAAMLHDGDLEVNTPTVSKRRAPSSSITSPVTRRTPKRARTTAQPIDLTKTDSDESTSLNGNSSNLATDIPSSKTSSASDAKSKAKGSTANGRPAAGTFTSFSCRWKGCSADLHNFETLEQHIFKVHGKASRTKIFTCLWGDCPDPKKGPREYRDRDEWDYHVHRSHLQSLKHVCPVNGTVPPF